MLVDAIVTENLTRKFGELTAVDDVNLRVASGQFFGFLGPNGAGKSTTIKMLTGLLNPTAGKIQLLGIDFAQDPIEVKRQIGVVPEGMGLFDRCDHGFRNCALRRGLAMARRIAACPRLFCHDECSGIRRSRSAHHSELVFTHISQKDGLRQDAGQPAIGHGRLGHFWCTDRIYRHKRIELHRWPAWRKRLAASGDFPVSGGCGACWLLVIA